jgi:hypothetical protein
MGAYKCAILGACVISGLSAGFFGAGGDAGDLVSFARTHAGELVRPLNRTLTDLGSTALHEIQDIVRQNIRPDIISDASLSPEVFPVTKPIAPVTFPPAPVLYLPEQYIYASAPHRAAPKPHAITHVWVCSPGRGDIAATGYRACLPR